MIVLLSFLFLFSCNNEDLLNDALTDNTDTPDGNGEIISTPCDFTLDNVSANSTVEIDCKLDLEGKTVVLPSNVNFEFKGGEIINGTLDFSGGVIDGKLLNYQLTITGDAQLKEPTFFFDPERWDIVQGETSSEVALDNNQKLEGLIYEIKRLGGTTFEIDEFDAYFEVSKVTSTTTNQNYYPSKEAVNVPSDFNLKMSSNTHLRVFPNDKKKYALLAIRDDSNVTITGGNLHGDRDEHDYSSGGTHEWGHLLELHGAQDVEIKDVVMSMGSGDGMKIHSLNHNFQPNYIPSQNIVVSNCTFDANRRNNLSITDGNTIIVENCTFLNAGIDTPNSEGTAPKFGIDVEAYRTRGDDGELIFYEKATDIIIRNNTEKGSAAGGFLVAIGDDVTLENNTVENGIGFTLATGVKIINNRIIGNGDMSENGITAGKPGTETTYNNEISGNTIEGYGTGITLYNKQVKVFDNNLVNTRNGILIPDEVEEAEIYNNTFTSNVSGSHGIFVHIASADNVTIYENDFDTDSYGMNFVNVNLDASAANNEVLVRDNTFASNQTTRVHNSRGINVEE
ncbi:right-handed parallel beta-helix repeat-containing protein [Galbibacter mesophilus]|uniref:right-handed parallel beta-helix repeat-containing protein n=1 Tax=Galbibacter mesophilus TaxID=379069 RepID=UPI00191CFA17|nr:right-handed parallel beta-helix repeat-containing protein [Galbibacter mesophilus]MCM5663418.1 right-handed parallel beta-helix repeat-containing protein [Galbibacter mesophilus]